MSSDAPSSPDESCTLATCPIEYSYSAYQPTFLGNLVYAIVFAVCLIAHFVSVARHRTWGFTAAFVCGLILEICGYTGRMLMHYNPFKETNFMLYLVPLTIAPAFLTAAIYLCLARIIVLYNTERGAEVSRLRPGTYTIIFVVCDFISLLLQAAGGAIASMADNKSLEDTGINIMIAGLAFQVASMTLFIGLAAEVGWRIRTTGKLEKGGDHDVSASVLFKRFLIGRPPPRALSRKLDISPLTIAPTAITVATVCIYIRCVYRVAELSGGFNGKLANQQESFMVLEGLMMVLAVIALTIYSPGRSFQGKWASMNFSFRHGSKAEDSDHTQA